MVDKELLLYPPETLQGRLFIRPHSAVPVRQPGHHRGLQPPRFLHWRAAEVADAVYASGVQLSSACSVIRNVRIIRGLIRGTFLPDDMMPLLGALIGPSASILDMTHCADSVWTSCDDTISSTRVGAFYHSSCPQPQASTEDRLTCVH